MKLGNGKANRQTKAIWVLAAVLAMTTVSAALPELVFPMLLSYTIAASIPLAPARKAPHKKLVPPSRGS